MQRRVEKAAERAKCSWRDAREHVDTLGFWLRYRVEVLLKIQARGFWSRFRLDVFLEIKVFALST